MWAMPIPLRGFNASYRLWIFKNFLGITFHGLVLYLLIEPMLGSTKINSLTKAINMLTISALIYEYCTSVLQVISIEKRA